MKFLYVLVSNGKDKYMDMTYLSASFLRFNHPDDQIIVATDEISYKSIKSSDHPLLKVVNVFLKLQTPSGNAGYKSRYLKCRMREIVEGNFVFIDSDTIPVRPLDELFETKSSFSAAFNHSRNNLQNNFGWYEREIYDKLNWKYPEEYYFNSGVLYWKSSDEAFELSKLYISKWEQSYNVTGYYYDQPALNSAISEWKGEVQIMDNKFNAQLVTNISSSIDAHLWHFYSSSIKDILPNYFSIGLKIISAKKEIRTRLIKKVTNSRIPFISNSKTNEEEIINLINRKSGKIRPYEYYYMRKQYLLFLIKRLSEKGTNSIFFKIRYFLRFRTRISKLLESIQK